MPVHKFNYQVIHTTSLLLRALGHRSHESQSIRASRNPNIIKLDQRIEMPPKKQEEPKSAAEQCMLRIGRYNNVVQWREDMQNEACGLYGMTGTFFTTNKSYVHPYPREEDYNPTFQTVEIDTATAGTENEDEDDDESVNLENVMIGPQRPPAPPVVYSEALIDRLRANAF